MWFAYFVGVHIAAFFFPPSSCGQNKCCQPTGTCPTFDRVTVETLPYTIERELGRGGMATVYLARDHRHDRQVALKVLRPDVAQSIGADRFLREIRLAAKLSHPHILPLFDSGELNGSLFYVMPNVEGLSLRDRIKTEGKLPVDDALKVVREVANALDYAHRHGVVHRDVKPENIMFQDGHAMVADFGIGKALSASDEQVFTQTGMSIGTPAYMSPEQASGDAIDGRSDIYSLGCVFYEMLTGEQPFTGPTSQAVIAKRFVQTPADVSGLREGVSRVVAKAVERALAREPVDRFETGAMLVAALSQPDSVARLDAPEKSIAVLPFASMSTDPENEFFADGVTEEILNALAQIPALRVAGRTSSFSFKGKNIDLRSIGEQLSVATVLEGSVRRAGKRVRITAQLIDVRDGYNMWSERYDREIEDVFAVQDEIATAIAEKMKAELKQKAAVIEQRATQSIEAYEAYLKGRALLYRRGSAIRQGIALMQRALELDPTYGLAWAGLADSYSLLGYYGLMPAQSAATDARDAAVKALELAPDLGEAHSARAMVSLLFDWDFDAAERGFLRALELNPASIQGAGWYYEFDLGFACNRWTEAIEGLIRLQQREPLSSYVASILSIANACGGDADEALRWSARALELEPDSHLSLWTRMLAWAAKHEWKKAIDAGEVVMSSWGRPSLAMIGFAVAHVEAGDVDGARALYDEMRSRSRREPFTPMGLAIVAAAVGENDAGLAYLDDAIARHDPQVPLLARAWEQARFLRLVPGFEQRIAMVGLPPSPAQSG
jgi:eukaryotic-like serine/threonine-protein kinase